MVFINRTRDARTKKFESSREWREVSSTFRHRNSICQVIEADGRRCTQATRVAHHIVPPEVSWDLRKDWKNLVGVCDHHHGPEAGDVGRYDYAPTNLFDGSHFYHVRRVRANDPNAPVMTGEPGKQFTSGAPSSEKTEALLDDVRDVDPDALLESLCLK